MRYFAVFSLVLSLNSTCLGRLTDQDFMVFKSPFFEPLRPEMAGPQKSVTDYPFLIRWLHSDGLKIERTGRSNLINSSADFLKECSLQKWTTACDNKIKTIWQDPISNTYGTLMLSGPLANHPFARPVYFHLPNDVKIKGILGWRGDMKKRPLVLFRGGIFSNTKEFYAEKYLFQQLFEQSSFNFILLQSMTGPEYPEDNPKYAIGGFDEGLQNFLIAQKLQDPTEPLSQIVSEVHLMGVSFGGHGVMFSAILNQLNKPAITSVLALCPLINMKETIDFHRAQGSIEIMNFWSKTRMPSVLLRYPKIDQSDFLPSLISEIVASYSGPLVGEAKVKLPKSFGGFSKNYWRMNDFWQEFKEIKTPTMIVATRKDPFVPYVLNSGRIESQEMKFVDSNLKLVPLEGGYHCSLPVAYDWKAIATLLQDYVYSNSKFERKLIEKTFSVNSSGEVSYKVRFSKNGKVLLKFYFDGGWFSSFETEIEPSEFDFKFEKALDDEEKTILRRWIYQNVEARIENRNLVVSWFKL